MPRRVPRSSSTMSAARSPATGWTRRRPSTSWVRSSAPVAAPWQAVTTWPTGIRLAALVEFARASFGDLHVLINNAGILRDRVLVNITEDDWDSVMRVHLKGASGAAGRRRPLLARSHPRPGPPTMRRIINTTSGLGSVRRTLARPTTPQRSSASSRSRRRPRSRAHATASAPTSCRRRRRTRLSLSVPSGAPQPEPASGTFDPPTPRRLARRRLARHRGMRRDVSGLPRLRERALRAAHTGGQGDLRLSTQGRWTIEACAREVPPHAAEPVGDEAFFPGVP